MTDTSRPELPVCSAKACRASAAWTLAWRNPRLHAPDRRKTWVACTEHRDSLAEYLRVRGFLRDVEPVPAAGRAEAGPDPTT